MRKGFMLLCLPLLLGAEARSFDFPGPLPGTKDFFNLFLQKFSFAQANMGNGNSTCRDLSELNRGILGDSNPITGEPLLEIPNATFWDWYLGCLQQLWIPAQFQALQQKPELIQRQWLGQEVSAFVVSQNGRPWKDIKWKELKGDLQAKVVLSLADVFLGPGIVEEFGWVPATFATNVLGGLKKVETKLNRELNFNEALQMIALYLMSSDEFLVY